jgi:glycogen synthase
VSAADVVDALVGLGGLGGIGALVTSLATLAKTRQVRADTSQLRPDHGSSVADKIDGLVDDVHSLGHQVGEMNRRIDREQDDRRAGDQAIIDRLNHH